MKRIVAMCMVAVLACSSLVGCQSQTSSTTESSTSPSTSGETTNNTSEVETLKIITTIFAPYDFAREVGGEYAEVIMLLKPGMESHSYEPTPQDIIAIQNCDLFIYTGSENDAWVEGILDSMGEDRPESLCLMDCVDTVAEEIVEGMEHEHDHDEEDADHVHTDEEEEHDHADEEEADHVHTDEEEDHDHDHAEEETEIDEHVWTSLKNAVIIVEILADWMSEYNPEYADTYQANSATYVAQLQELDAQFQEVVDNAQRNTILFGDRFPFRYFVDDYGIEYYAAFTGCSTETEASAATIVFLIEKVQELDLPVVFTIELSTAKIAESICEATGAENLTFSSCHNITADQMAEGVTYLSLMEENVESLRIALN